MYDLQKIAGECIAELKAIDIPIQDGKIREIIAVQLDKDGYVGHCIVTKDGGFRIEIWEEMLSDDVRLVALKSLVCHELLHTCEDCMNHRGKFRRYLRKVDKYYDYGMMTGDDDYLNPSKPVLVKIQCSKCKYIQLYRKEENYKNIMQLYRMSDNLLPRCPYCRGMMVLIKDKDVNVAD